jgi:trigger factor
MAVEIQKKENSVVVLTIDVDPETFAKAMQRSFTKNARRFSIPGFRPGKAPYHVVLKYYGEGVLYDDAVDACINEEYPKVVVAHDLQPVAKPEIDILEIGGAKGLKFTATVTVKPEVILGKYLGVSAEKPVYPVSEEDVDKDLERVRERNARMVPVEDRPIADGDTVTIDYEGSVDGIPFEGGKDENHDLKIGSNSFIPGFEAQLVGHSAGESFEIEVTFPEDYQSEALKGQKAVFAVKVLAVKLRELPVLDDEFAKDVSEFDTLAEYRKSLRAKLEDDAAHKAEHAYEENVLKEAVGNATVAIPQPMVDREIDHMVEDYGQRMRYQGLELEQYLQYLGQTMDEFRKGFADMAEVRVKTQLVVEAVGKAEGVTATDEEVEEEIGRMATVYGMKPEELKTRITPGEDGFLRENVVSRKTLELLTAAAKPTAAKAETAEKPAKAKKAGKADKADADEKPAKAEKAPKSDKPAKTPKKAE